MNQGTTYQLVGLERDAQVLKLNLGQATLYHRGWCNLGWQQVFDSLKAGRFPEQIRGNFGFVYLDPVSQVAAVDHLCTHPVFYGERKFSFNFFDLIRTIPNFSVIETVRLQMKMLGGHHFSENTTVQDVKRLLPGTYIQNGKVTRYFDHASLISDRPLDRNQFRELFESRVQFYSKEQNVLMFTSGTDSTTLAAVFKKLRRLEQVHLLHAYSDVSFKSEKDLAEKIALEMDLKVDFVPVQPLSASELNRIHDFRLFWWDYSFWPKKIALEARPEAAGMRQIFTGEIGDQLFGGSKVGALVSYALQSAKVSSEEVAELWINKSGNNRSLSLMTQSTVRLHPKLAELVEHADSVREAHREIKQDLVRLFESLPTKDLVTKFQYLNLVTKGPLRLYTYSQDRTEKWAHPFADWEVVQMAMGCQSGDRIFNHGRSKALLYDLWKDYLSEVPWKSAKAGTQAHVRQEFRHLS